MAWEDLLRRHSAQKETQPQPQNDETWEKGSLIRQVSELVGQSGAESAALPANDGVPQEPLVYADGYERRSPVQIYQTAEDFQQRRIRKVITIIVVAIMALLLVYALMKSGLLIFRLR